MKIAETPRHRDQLYPIAFIALSLFFFVAGARWIWLYRNGQPVDADEAGYLSLALVDYFALVRGGVSSWITAVLGPGVQPPVVLSLASLSLYLSGGPNIVAAFAVPLLSGVGCIISTFYLGRAISSPHLGMMAAILVGSCPLVLDRSRNFHFSLPATLVLTLCLLAMIKSERFIRIGWAVMFGLFLGLLPLTRTMTIAFLPGVIIAAVIHTVADRTGRRKRIAILIGSLLVATLTSATWFWPNGEFVFSYLLNFGYGSRAAEYGAERTFLGLDAWKTMLMIFHADIYFPHLLLIIVGCAAAILVGLRSATKFSAAAMSPITPAVIVVAEALIALVSSRNTGSAFQAPIIPACLLISTWGLLQISDRIYYRAFVSVFVIAMSIMTTFPLLDLKTPFSSTWSVNLPIIGGVIMTNGSGTMQKYESDCGLGPDNVAEPISAEEGYAWLRLDKDTQFAIAELAGSSAMIATGFRHCVYNVNSINLQRLAATGTQFGARQVEPSITGQSVDGYRNWLNGEAKDTCVLLTSETVRGNFLPLVDPDNMRKAAEDSGFNAVRHMRMPDNQNITLWTKNNPPSGCHK
jgi:4-amino-4-deoxy-L-arabinose transferase-like glycosyltransferase